MPWYVEHNGRTLGPISSEKLKQLADADKINRSTKIRKQPSDPWSAAGSVKGLFPAQVVGQLITTQPTPTRTITPIAETPLEPARRPCPHCSEDILASAVKCKHCGEYLDGRQTQPPPPAAPAPAPAPAPVVVQTFVNVAPNRRWSPGTAALLSFLLPGLGQLYKGQPLNGLMWFFLTGVGYICFIIPGVILHLFCIFGAASGDPTR